LSAVPWEDCLCSLAANPDAVIVASTDAVSAFEVGHVTDVSVIVGRCKANKTCEDSQSQSDGSCHLYYYYILLGYVNIYYKINTID
jgi:hypothetical protein